MWNNSNEKTNGLIYIRKRKNIWLLLAVFCSFVGLLSLWHIPRFNSQFYILCFTLIYDNWYKDFKDKQSRYRWILICYAAKGLYFSFSVYKLKWILPRSTRFENGVDYVIQIWHHKALTFLFQMVYNFYILFTYGYPKFGGTLKNNISMLPVYTQKHMICLVCFWKAYWQKWIKTNKPP